jgi:predicted ester cyclase
MDPKTIARDILQRIFNDRDPKAVDELVAPDCDDHAIGPGDRNGADGVRAFAQALWQAFPDGRFEQIEVLGEGDRACTRAVFTGTHRGHFFDVPPSNRRVRLDRVDVVRVVDGKCVEHWGGFEAGAVIRQLALRAPEFEPA